MKKLSIFKKSIISKLRSQYRTEVPPNELGSRAVAIVGMILVSASAMAELSTACDPNAPDATVIMGTEGRDFLRGTSGDDVIIGLGGNDTILGFGGNDCIEGGEGNDLIFGRGGDDQLIGGPGNDRIFSSGGADMVTGGAGDDQIFGGAGNDEIDGNDGENKISGGPGMDACANGILSSCEKDIVPPIMMSQSIVSGRVFEADGSAVPGVSISAFKNGEPFSFPKDESPIQSSDDGSFEIFLATEEEVTLKFDADGFATQILPVKAPALEDGKVSLDVMMIARGDPQTVNAIDGGTITGTDGAAITIATDSFVDEAGNPLLDGDTIVLTVTPVDISTPAGIASFPGEFSGVAEDETTESPIVSYGAVEYDLTLEGTGEKVQLAGNQTSDILIPLYNKEKLEEGGGDYAVGDTIALWSLNELIGIWQQEGTGTVVESDASPTGLALQATVSHFTWWNCDVSINAARALVTVLGEQQGTALIKARTTGNIGGRPTLVDALINVGETSRPLPVPSNVETCFWAELNFIDGSQGITEEKCFTPSSSLSFPVELGIASDDPLAITATPVSIASETIIGVKNRKIEIIKLRSLSIETEVSYVISNDTPLPNGMGLTSTSATGAIISGIPSEASDFRVDIIATDSDDNTDAIILNYSILDEGLQPPIWQDDTAVMSNFMNRSDAIIYCGGLEIDGRMDWKLPTRDYFFDMCKVAPSWINNSPTGEYWFADGDGNNAYVFSYQIIDIPMPVPIFDPDTDEFIGDEFFPFLTNDFMEIPVDESDSAGVRCVIGEPTPPNLQDSNCPF